MVHEIAPKRFFNEYFLYSPKEEDIVVIFKGKQALCKRVGDDIVFPKVKDIEDKSSLLYLFCIDETSVYTLKDDEPVELDGFEYLGIRDTRTYARALPVFILFTAWHLYLWYRDNRYCGRCGRQMKVSLVERKMECECGNNVYPKIMPAVIVGVRRKEEILLTKYAHRNLPNYALIAGFCEIGESAEQTVAREVMEEAGLKVKNITYFATQPWGIDQDLLLGYYCDVDGDGEIKIDERELSTAVWVNRKDIEPRTQVHALTATMIETFRQGKDPH